MKIKLKYSMVLILSSLMFFSCAKDPASNDNTDTTTDVKAAVIAAEPEAGEDSGVTTDSTPTPETLSFSYTEEIKTSLEKSGDVIFDATGDINIEPKFLLKVGEDYYASDGIKAELWKSGNIAKAGPNIFSVENQLLTLDASGDTLSTVDLDHTPTRIKSTEDGNYYCVEIQPADAYAQGGRYKYYTDIYKDGVNISGHWSLNQYRCSDIVSVGANVFIKNEYGAYHVISGTSDNVAHVESNRFYMHNIDMIGKNIGFNDNTESFHYNYAPISRQWILYEGVEYSGTGYTWTEIDGLSSDGFITHEWTAMSDFNEYPYPIEPELPFGEHPVLLAAGVSEGKLYWIECNAGWLFEYDPETDTLKQIWRVYNGDGMHIAGVSKRESLKPIIIDHILYFSNDESVFSLGIDDGFVNVFYAGEGEVIGYD